MTAIIVMMITMTTIIMMITMTTVIMIITLMLVAIMIIVFIHSFKNLYSAPPRLPTQ